MVDKINPQISSLPIASGVVRKSFQNEFKHKEKKFEQKKRKIPSRESAEPRNIENDECEVEIKKNNKTVDSIDIFI